MRTCSTWCLGQTHPPPAPEGIHLQSLVSGLSNQLTRTLHPAEGLLCLEPLPSDAGVSPDVDSHSYPQWQSPSLSPRGLGPSSLQGQGGQIHRPWDGEGSHSLEQQSSVLIHSGVTWGALNAYNAGMLFQDTLNSGVLPVCAGGYQQQVQRLPPGDQGA